MAEPKGQKETPAAAESGFALKVPLCFIFGCPGRNSRQARMSAPVSSMSLGWVVASASQNSLPVASGIFLFPNWDM